MIKTKEIAKYGLVAALYIALSLVLAPLSFGAIQMRLGEMLKVLPFFNRKYTIALVIACVIVNLFSPLGMIDVIIGTANTIVCCLIVERVKHIALVPVLVAVISGLFIGFELNLVFGLPFIYSAITVAIGQLVVVTLGVIVFKTIQKKSKNLFKQIVGD